MGRHGNLRRSRTLLTLCATQRLARHLRRAARQPGRVTPAPAVTTSVQWILEQGEALTLSGTDLPACLSPEAERLLWEQAITADLGKHAHDLFDITGLAQTAQAAQALIAHWGPPSNHGGGVEAQHFYRWQRLFDRLRGDAIDLGRWQRAVMAHLNTHDLPAAVHWTGFDRMTPLEHELNTVFTAHGVAVSIATPLGDPTPPRLQGYTDAHSECAAIAAWAQQQLQRNPNSQLGIVVQDLATSGPGLRRALDAVVPGQYNLSLGTPLAQEGPVRAVLDALHILSQTARSIPKTELSRHLTHPYWPGEPDARALRDATLREQPGETASTPFASTTIPKALPPSAWRDWIRQWLADSGWPGTRPLDSGEHQAIDVLADLLQRFGALDAVAGAWSLTRALTQLQRMAREQPFQIQTLGERPIEVLGLLESTGLTFDALWISGLSADTWPPSPHPNPLLPPDWQRERGMPHASHAVERDFALRVQARLLRAAPEITFSWVCEEQGRSIGASPLIPATPDYPGLPPSIWPPAELETLDDHHAPPLSEVQRAQVRGGSGLLKAQALCPAWAFYRYRLNAKALPDPEPLLNHQRRGTLMHRALELFWLDTQNHASLLALPAEARRNRIERCATQALDTHAPQLTPLIRRLELGRMQRYLSLWLDHEAAQNTPFHIEVLEKSCPDTPVGPLILAHLKIDRIDRLTDGSLRVIDYKTGKSAPSTKGWEDEHLCEPQIPLYTLIAAQNGPVSAAVFGHLGAEVSRFIGKSGDALTPLLQRWPAQLEALAQGYAEGDASVRYARIQDLDRCEVRPLLRLEAPLEDA